jgi:hypothetical protein
VARDTDALACLMGARREIGVLDHGKAGGSCECVKVGLTVQRQLELSCQGWWHVLAIVRLYESLRVANMILVSVVGSGYECVMWG